MGVTLDEEVVPAVWKTSSGMQHAHCRRLQGIPQTSQTASLTPISRFYWYELVNSYATEIGKTVYPMLHFDLRQVQTESRNARNSMPGTDFEFLRALFGHFLGRQNWLNSIPDAK